MKRGPSGSDLTFGAANLVRLAIPSGQSVELTPFSEPGSEPRYSPSITKAIEKGSEVWYS